MDLPPNPPDLMSRREVAAYFAVNVKTVSRWEKQGLIKADRVTLGGHHRYFRESVMELAGKKWTKKVEKNNAN